MLGELSKDLPYLLRIYKVKNWMFVLLIMLCSYGLKTNFAQWTRLNLGSCIF